MVTYPLTFPSVNINEATFRKQSIVSASVSPFTAEEQLYASSGEWWEGDVTFVPSQIGNAGLVKSFVSNLRGRFGTFLYGDPDHLEKGAQGAGGTINIDGGAQSGYSVNVRDMTPSVSGVLVEGDYIQLGSGLTARLHMVTERLDSDASGSGTLTLWPAVVTPPSDGDLVKVDRPMGLFRLSENSAEWSIGSEQVYGIVLSFRSVV